MKNMIVISDGLKVLKSDMCSFMTCIWQNDYLFVVHICFLELATMCSDFSSDTQTWDPDGYDALCIMHHI